MKQHTSKLVLNNIKEALDEGSFFRFFGDSSHEPISVVDTEGNPVYVNDSYFKISSYSREELSKHENLVKLLHPDSVLTFKNFWEYFAQNKVFDESPMLIKWVNKNNQLVYLENSIRNIYNPADEVIGFLTISRNLTPYFEVKKELVKSVARVSESERSLNELIDHAPIVIQFFNKDGFPIRSNKKFEEVSGFTHEEIRGFSIFQDRDIMNQGFMPEVKKAFEEGVSVELPVFKFTGLLTTRKKQDFYIKLSFYPQVSEQGEVEKVVMFQQDFTKEKYFENFLNEVNGIAQMGGWSYHVDTDKLLLTKEGYAIHDLQEGEKVSLKDLFEEMYLYGDSTSSRALFVELFEKQKPVKDYCRIKTRKGNIKWVIISGQPEFKTGQVVRYIGRIQDVTDEKLREQELEKANMALKKSNAELDRFVYSVSHDLRAPLTSIMGLIDISEKENDINNVKDYLKLIKESTNKLDEFIKDIIHYSRNNRLEIQKEKLNLKELISNCLSNLAHIKTEKPIDIKVEVNENSTFIGDTKRIGMVLNNLISNSYRYSDFKKTCPTIQIKAEVNASNCFIQVKDNGIGIEGEIKEKIFDMFYRGSEDSQGSGLGLYIVKETLDKIGGTITCSSKAGEWTCFDVEMPNFLNVSTP